MRKKRILVIDDEEVITFGFSLILKEPDVEVDCAHTIDEARNLIGVRKYDAAIVDLRLSESPDLEGFDCIKLLHEHQRNCKIIVLTAYGDNGVRERADGLGVDCFFEKPLEPEILKETLMNFNVYRN